jgi:hypothetical protein
MDFVARWLGVPWDDALMLPQKRAILQRAADLAKGRGTRIGLETLLEALIPETPRRFRVTDPMADCGFAIVGGELCRGSGLPAILGKSVRQRLKLGANTRLGSAMLPCEVPLDRGVWQSAGRIAIEVAATAAERILWEPWLLRLVTEMVPLSTTVEVHWISAQMLRTNRLDDALTLEASPTAHLGTDAITGLARLPDKRVSISATGPILGGRLR